jgi:putative ATPase
VDEIHRFNRAQQDGFLPVVEDGTVTLVGATTENPSFALNGALLSRCQVLVLKRLDDDALEKLLARAEAAEDRALPLTPEARATLRAMADGDGRYLLNMAEQLFASRPAASRSIPPRSPRCWRSAPRSTTRTGRSTTTSSPRCTSRCAAPTRRRALLVRAHADGGEDPRYIARRLTRFAAEDVGMADPRALPLAIAAWETYERSARRKANWRWRSSSCISPPRRNPTPSMPPSAPRCARRRRPAA